MANNELFAVPDDEAKKRLINAGVKTLKLLLNTVIMSGVGDVVDIALNYARDHFDERNRRRTKELNSTLEKAPEKVRAVLESPEQFEPLLDVFMSVYRTCLSDDEDDKVPYYAALMAGFASPDAPALTGPQKMALLQSLKNLRAHDIRVLELVRRTKGHRPPGPCVPEMKRQSENPLAEPVYKQVDWDIVPQGLRGLISYGLVNDDPRQEAAAVPQPNRYQLTKLGDLFWQKCIEFLPPAR